MITSVATVGYWRRRYARGGISGPGSRGKEAEAKAALIDRVVRCAGLTSVLDLGCGDGYVASLLTAPPVYVGYDPAIPKSGVPAGPFDLVLSFDVLFHLVHDAEYRAYLATLFNRGPRVLVWSTDHDEQGAKHVRHRHWTPDIPAGWAIVEHAPTGFGRKAFWLLERAT